MTVDQSEPVVENKIELPTALYYATLRNWRELPKHDVTIFTSTPRFFHIDYLTCVKAIMQHVDAQGRIHYLDPKTGDEAISFALPILQAPSDPEIAQQLVTSLAQEVYTRAAQIVTSYFDITNGTQEEDDMRDYFEGQAAYAIAPYRYEPELLRQVIERVRRAQREDAISIQQSI